MSVVPAATGIGRGTAEPLAAEEIAALARPRDDDLRVVELETLELDR